MKGGVHEAFVDFLVGLRKKDELSANRLFLQAINYLGRQPSVNVLDLHSLGLYLFSNADNVGTDYAEQRKYSYALCYMLLPKSRIVAPDLTAKFDAVMAALSPQVPAH